MPSTFIERTIVTTTIHISEVVNENGTPTAQRLNPIKESGKLTLEKAQRLVDKRFEGKRVTVFQVQHDEKKYRLPLTKFMEHADVVTDEEKPAEQ